METATFAGGCFWCTEAIFQRLKGVSSVTPGYSGGAMENPTYEDVSSGDSGHTEAIQIKFGPKEISYNDLLEVFFATHDPTTLNRQGADVGSQYRSVIFYADEAQRQAAHDALSEAQKNYKDKIVTEIAMFTAFYPAENYHKDYYNQNRGAGYCKLVIDPKIQKLTKEFSEKLQ